MCFASVLMMIVDMGLRVMLLMLALSISSCGQRVRREPKAMSLHFPGARMSATSAHGVWLIHVIQSIVLSAMSSFTSRHRPSWSMKQLARMFSYGTRTASLAIVPRAGRSQSTKLNARRINEMRASAPAGFGCQTECLTNAKAAALFGAVASRLRKKEGALENIHLAAPSASAVDAVANERARCQTRLPKPQSRVAY